MDPQRFYFLTTCSSLIIKTLFESWSLVFWLSLLKELAKGELLTKFGPKKKLFTYLHVQNTYKINFIYGVAIPIQY